LYHGEKAGGILPCLMAASLAIERENAMNSAFVIAMASGIS
jgi:hypothetical protein